MHNGLIPHDLETDHIGGDRANNRLENLRLVTHAQNMRNRAACVNGSSRYKGVRQVEQRWEARIGFEGRNIYLGSRDNEREAAMLYDNAATKYFGEFVVLNLSI